MNQAKDDELEKTADGDPLEDRGIADTARATVSDPDDDELEEEGDEDDGDEDDEDTNV